MSNVARLRTLVVLCLTCVRLKSVGRGDELPRVVYLQFRKLGGVYIKFLQLLVVQSTAFRDLREYDIYDVYDQVGYDSLDIQMLLERELGQHASDLSNVSAKPFAAGSFGQVYSATYQSKTVILKVLRPSVQRSLNFDLRLITWFSWLIDLLAGDSAVNSRQVCKDLVRATRAETNYLLEADYASMLYDRYKNHATIVIPKTYREMSTNHIICQDYVGGVLATDVLRAVQEGHNPSLYVMALTGSDLTEQLVGFGTELLQSIFTHGSTYGDPHPGNIKFLPNNKIALIDYGLQGRSPNNLPGFYNLVLQYNRLYNGDFDMPAYARAILEMYGGDIVQAAHSLETRDGRTVVDDMVDMVSQLLHEGGPQLRSLLEDKRLPHVFSMVINRNNQFCLRYNLDGTEMIRASQLFITLTKLLGLKQEVMQRTYATVVQNVDATQLGAMPVMLHPETALEITAAWLDEVAHKNPRLHRQVIERSLQYA